MSSVYKGKYISRLFVLTAHGTILDASRTIRQVRAAKNTKRRMERRTVRKN